MPIYFGDKQITTIFVGDKELTSGSFGDNQVFSSNIVLLDSDNGIDLINNSFTKIRIDGWGGTDGSVSKSDGVYTFTAPSAPEYHASGSCFVPTILQNGDIDLHKYKYLKVVHQVSSINSGTWGMGVRNNIGTSGQYVGYNNIFAYNSTFAKRTNTYTLSDIPTPFYFGIQCSGHNHGGTTAKLYYLELTNKA